MVLLQLSIGGNSITQSSFKKATVVKQVWMTKNLDVDKFRNGDLIPEAKTDKEWKNADERKEPAWCYYDNDPSNGAKYGKLYNLYAVLDPRGLAPKGWHVPTNSEWTVLTDWLGGEDVAGHKMKNKSGWKEDGNGNNKSRFSGLPGGCRSLYGNFAYMGNAGYWWSSSEALPYDGLWFRILVYQHPKVGLGHNDPAGGYSVRCVKD